MKTTPLTKDMYIQPELLGLEVNLNSFANYVSSQRLSMQAGACNQAAVIDGNEHARISTGYDNAIGKYEITSAEIKNDIQILHIIPKYRLNVDIKNNPEMLLIYYDLSKEEVNYVTIQKHTHLSDGFGYENKMLNSNLLQKDMYIEGGTKFQTSPNHDGGIYNQGLNANVAYMSIDEVAEDAFVISRSLANRLTHTAINSISIDIPKNSIPLNLYGDSDSYKIFPDIGEKVRDDGVVFCLRPKNKDTFLSDMRSVSLNNPEYLHNDVFKAPAGAEIIDIQVYMSHRVFKNSQYRNSINEQLFKYQEQHNWYYQNILTAYNDVKRNNLKISSKFNQLVTKTMCLISSNNRIRNEMKLTNKKEIIEFAHLTITYKYKRHVNKGFKLTGIDGS